MATTKFKTTMDAFKDGVKKMPIDKAVGNIEGWEEYLQKHDGEGVKAVLADLGKLKKLLQADDVDSEAVNKLLEKVGKDTVKAAGKADNAEAKHIRELGEALTSASEDEEDEDDDETVDAEDDDEELEDDEDDVEDEGRRRRRWTTKKTTSTTKRMTKTRRTTRTSPSPPPRRQQRHPPRSQPQSLLPRSPSSPQQRTVAGTP